jgi:hypothetical protein
MLAPLSPVELIQIKRRRTCNSARPGFELSGFASISPK